MEYKGERAQRRLDELLSEIDDWATEAFWTGFYSGCERERDLMDEINWLNAELHGAELKARKARKAERTCHDATNDKQVQAFTCSECGCWVAYDEYMETGIYIKSSPTEHIHPRYCPNCGAKVVEE